MGKTISALDTNVLAYAEGLNGRRAKASTLRVLRRLPPEETLIPVQVLGELFAVLMHKLGIWDAIVLSAAADAGCRLSLSEDLQDGFTWQGVTVANPFAPRRT